MNWIKKLLLRKEDKTPFIQSFVRGGTYCKCMYCKNMGYAYGIPSNKGVSCGFCQYCGKNNELIPVYD